MCTAPLCGVARGTVVLYHGSNYEVVRYKHWGSASEVREECGFLMGLYVRW